MKDIYDNYIDQDILNAINDEFNIELKKYKIYDQKGSMLCWIYASLNLIKRELANKLKIDEEYLDFSVNYISFFDRYEKLNILYDEIINNDYEFNNIKYLLFDLVNTFGSFASFKYLVNKYGMVLEHQMPSNSNLFLPDDINKILKEKVLNDVEILLNAKESKTQDALNKMKKELLEEDYRILSNIFGEPPKIIDLNFLQLNSMTTLEFKNQYVRDILNQYINVTSLTTFDYNREYELSFNVPNLETTKYLNVDIAEIKSAIIKSLKDGYPVWFGCSYRFMSGSIKNKNGILDSLLYRFDKIGVKKLSKDIAEKYDFLNYDHAMIFTGVDIAENKSAKWKVLNTFGKENNREGYFIMNSNFFDENVFLFAIKKQYFDK